jgi:hypothetical protein
MNAIEDLIPHVQSVDDLRESKNIILRKETKVLAGYHIDISLESGS